MLIGADMLGNILKGKCEKLECGHIKETLLGLVVFGNILGEKINIDDRPNTISNTVTNLYTQSTNFLDLSTLHVLRIMKEKV